MYEARAVRAFTRLYVHPDGIVFGAADDGVDEANAGEPFADLWEVGLGDILAGLLVKQRCDVVAVDVCKGNIKSLGMSGGDAAICAGLGSYATVTPGENLGAATLGGIAQEVGALLLPLQHIASRGSRKPVVQTYNFAVHEPVATARFLRQLHLDNARHAKRDRGGSG